MSKAELIDYASVHAICTGNLQMGNLQMGYDEDAGNGFQNTTFHRRLCLAVLSSDFDKVSTDNDKPTLIERYYHKHQDHGATYLFNTTKADKRMPVYRDRARMALYLTRKSVKLAYLTGLIWKICGEQGRKAIVFCDWPSTAWLVEVLMLLFGFSVISIRVKHKQKEREEAVALFSEKSCTVQVLITSNRIASTAISL